MYFKILNAGLHLQNTQPQHTKALAALQTIVFPTLSEAERMAERHYRHHLQLFPEGQFVVLDGDQPVAMTSTIRHPLTLEDHTFLEISDHLWLNTHEPTGDWLYGMDMGVHPDYRGRGLARELYRARQETCRQLGLKGQITVGMPNGYFRYADRMPLEQYYELLVKGELKDPTVSAQQKIGFQPIRLIPNYLDDPSCGHGGVLMVLRVEQVV